MAAAPGALYDLQYQSYCERMSRLCVLAVGACTLRVRMRVAVFVAVRVCACARACV